MKIGVMGDVHANLDALKAVLEALDRADVDHILCAGDIVGYGACPRECIDVIRERGIVCVKGNHDEYATQLGADWRIHPDARTVIHWTQKQLTKNYLEWLANLPRLARFEDIEVVHSSYVWWPRWSYVINQRTAVGNFMFQVNRISFNAHTHVPVFVAHQEQQAPRLEILHNMFLPRKQRLLLGVGSVGQPRDGDPRACCLVYDSARKSVRVLRVRYDIDAAQARVRNAGLPDDLARRLAAGR